MRGPDKLKTAATISGRIPLALLLAVFFGGGNLPAANNPFEGYLQSDFYFLSYSGGTSFAPSNTSDVTIDAKVGGHTLSFNVDTGSRGLYGRFGDDFVLGANPYPGEVQLTSSGRVSTGTWSLITVEFNVTDKNNSSTTVGSTFNVLHVSTLGAQVGKTATFGVTGTSGTVNLDGGGTVPIVYDASKGEYVVQLVNNGSSVNQTISYANNTPGLIKDVSNFGIGFDLNGAPGGTGPVGNNMNQIYNPLLNLDAMQNGTLVAGYVVTKTGIKLGLTTEESGYAYTTLNPTIYASTNSVPDWQTPMGQTVVSGTTNGPGSVVMDSGISGAYISAPGLVPDSEVTTPVSVYLVNSGSLVGYLIDPSDANNVLNPTKLEVSAPGTDGVYSQNQLPYRENFFNTGRNVFKAFDMLYDAENGYMGVRPNEHGLTDPNVFFAAQAGGFPNPIPEPGSMALVVMGSLLLLERMRGIRRARRPRRAERGPGEG